MDIKINRNIVSRLIEGKYYLVDSKGHILHSLNETGTFIFERLKKKRKDIIRDICKEYEATPEQAGQDLNEFIETLKSKKICLP
jgi:hypothetical protein